MINSVCETIPRILIIVLFVLYAQRDCNGQDTRNRFYVTIEGMEFNDKIRLNLPMHFMVSNWYNGSAGIERGPLVYALKIKEG